MIRTIRNISDKNDNSEVRKGVSYVGVGVSAVVMEGERARVRARQWWAGLALIIIIVIVIDYYYLLLLLGSLFC
ncbi:unnamed protein product [Anisakis simplex]|uniref:Uncharacterized protein n=1 Tax=Anisakis simplex TaxID=6269 RepID=A0A0M3JPZ4_ANISI|nr:unnamed protein product [Anisakis simplex]